LNRYDFISTVSVRPGKSKSVFHFAPLCVHKSQRDAVGTRFLFTCDNTVKRTFVWFFVPFVNINYKIVVNCSSGEPDRTFYNNNIFFPAIYISLLKLVGRITFDSGSLKHRRRIVVYEIRQPHRGSFGTRM
jgi:hypothetical protein